MSRNFTAVFKNGVFVSDEECHLPENTRVQVTVDRESVIPPTVTDPDERQAILKRMAERRRNHPIPANAPSLTREELHERR